MLKNHLSKRWFVYAIIYFLVAYVGVVLLSTAYEILVSPTIFILLSVFHPLVALGIAYAYFRKARNDWTARFVVAIGWTFIFYALSVLLLPVVFGIPMSAGFTLDMLTPHWTSIVGIIVAGMAAHRSVIPMEEDPKEESALKQELMK